tara:strand:+ start:275 stop:574 length:300 start_codon:yes stop_codon:yes gene_type:complete
MIKLKDILNEADGKYESVEFVYTEQGGHFYGTDVKVRASQRQRTAKLDMNETNKYLRSLGINILVPRRYGFGMSTLDKIVKELKSRGIKADHNDFMDVS